MKLQRHLTHPRAPWAPAPSAEAEVDTEVYKLDKSENALRQRCRLRRVEGGTRHPEASISQKLVEAEQPPQGSSEAAARSQPAAASGGGSGIALLPSGVPLAKLCEGSDGEDWEESERKAIAEAQMMAGWKAEVRHFRPSRFRPDFLTPPMLFVCVYFPTLLEWYDEFNKHSSMHKQSYKSDHNRMT